MTRQSSRRFHTLACAGAAVLAMALAGCGSDGPAPQASSDGAPDEVRGKVSDILDKMSEAAKQAGAGDVGDPGDLEGLGDLGALASSLAAIDSDSSDEGSDSATRGGTGSADVRQVHPLAWHVPSEGATPAGFAQLPARCEAPDSENLETLSWISYAVPETWNVSGRTSGSDSPLSDTTKMSFYDGDGNSHRDYSIEFDTDRFEPDRASPNGWTMVDWEGNPWQSFDYEYQVGDDVYQIHFDKVATATVGKQQVEIVKAPQEQAPEALGSTEYRARILLAEMPTAPASMAGQEPPWIPRSSVISLAYDAESDRAEPLTDDLVVDIVSSIAIPECGKEYVVATTETGLNADIDGDDHVTTQQEMLEVMRGSR